MYEHCSARQLESTLCNSAIQSRLLLVYSTVHQLERRTVSESSGSKTVYESQLKKAIVLSRLKWRMKYSPSIKESVEELINLLVTLVT